MAGQTASSGASSSARRGWGWDSRCEVEAEVHAGDKHELGRESTFASVDYKAACPEELPYRDHWKGFAPSLARPCHPAGQQTEDHSDNASCVLAEGLHRIAASAARMPAEHGGPWVKDNQHGSGPCEAKGRPETRTRRVAFDDDHPYEGQDREELGGRLDHWRGQKKEACQGFLAGSGRAADVAAAGSGCWKQTGLEVKSTVLSPAS